MRTCQQRIDWTQARPTARKGSVLAMQDCVIPVCFLSPREPQGFAALLLGFCFGGKVQRVWAGKRLRLQVQRLQSRLQQGSGALESLRTSAKKIAWLLTLVQHFLTLTSAYPCETDVRRHHKLNLGSRGWASGGVRRVPRMLH